MNRLQSSNGDTDVEDRPVEAVGEGKGGTSWQSRNETYTWLYVK